MVVTVAKKTWDIHRNNVKGRRECFLKKKKIPGPVRGKFCVVPRPGPAIKKKMAEKKASKK